MARSYGTLSIRIRRQAPESNSYLAEAELADGSEFRDNIHIDLETLRQLDLNAEAYGRALSDAMFQGRIRSAYDRARGSADENTDGRLRIRLQLDDDVYPLHVLHWERLYTPDGPQSVALAASTTTPFSRYTGLEIPEPLPMHDRPLKLVIAIANPVTPNLEPINVEQEVQTLCEALGDLRRSNILDVTLLPGSTGLPDALRQRLLTTGYDIRDGATNLDQILRVLPGCHMLHIISHGAFASGSATPRQAALFLEGVDRSVAVVREQEIKQRLLALRPLPHLVFLAACDSAAQHDAHPFVGLAPRLVQAGVPAVVAMQDKVPMTVARQFATDFYRNVVDHGEVDLAVNQARLLLYNQRWSDWGIPVLYTRLKHALIDVTKSGTAAGSGSLLVQPGVNPFEVGNPVAPEQFYGQDRQKAFIKNRIGAKTPQHVSIIGQRRSGKSSLLGYIAERIDEFTIPAQHPLVVSLDLQDARFHSPAGITEGIRSGIKRMTGVEPWTQEQNEDHEAVENALSDLRERVRLILLFDEFELIGARLKEFHGWGEDIRSQASTRRLFTLAIASKRSLDEVYEGLGLTSPFGNIFTRTVLGALEEPAWHDLVISQFTESGLKAEPADLALIDELAGGLPFYTQMAASLIWEFRDHTSVREEFVFQATATFSTLWNDLTQQEQHAVRYAAGLPGVMAAAKATTDTLSRHGILRADGRLFSSAFADFVREQS